MRRDRARMSWKRYVLVCLAGLAVAACGGSISVKTPLDEKAPVDPGNPGRYGLQSRLKALGSGVSGQVRVTDRGDGVTLSLSMINLPQGPYRVAFGENANCTSPNGFSAGRAWAPATAGKDARNLVAPLYQSNDGSAEMS